MLIKLMIADNADGRRIISTVFGKNAGNISTYLELFFLPCYINGVIIVYELRCVPAGIHTLKVHSCSVLSAPYFRSRNISTEYKA